MGGNTGMEKGGRNSCLTDEDLFERVSPLCPSEVKEGQSGSE